MDESKSLLELRNCPKQKEPGKCLTLKRNTIKKTLVS